MKSDRAHPRQLSLLYGAAGPARPDTGGGPVVAARRRPGTPAPAARTATCANAGLATLIPAAPSVPAGVAGRPETTLPPGVSVSAVRRLASELRLLVGRPVKLLVHDNRSTMVSFRRDDDCLHLRVHHMFVGAGPEIVHALADYARARSAHAGKVLDGYVRANRGRIRPLDIERARARPLRTAGQVHDLLEIYDELNERYFDGTLDARIGWGRGKASRRRRSIRMGAYYHDTRTILIHPALDRPGVPRYFVALVVFHEMLHQAVPQLRTEGGRRCIHSKEFRAREREFHDYARARTWERRNLPLLLKPPRARAAAAV